MTTVKDLKDVDVEVVEDEDEDAAVGGRVCAGRESVGPTWSGLDAPRDSVVARLLMENRPPRLHTAACPSTIRRPTVGSDVVRGPRTLPPPVDLSAGKSKLDGEEDCRPTRSRANVVDTWRPGDSDVTSASRRLQLLHQKLPPQFDLSTILSDCRLNNRWLDLCSLLSASPSTASIHRSSATESNQHRYLPQYQARESSAANACDIPTPEGTTEERSVGSGSGSSQVLPALRRLLLKPLAGPSSTQPPKTVRGPSPGKLSSEMARESSDSPPTLKPEPLSTEPKIKQEVVAADNQHNGSDVPDRLKTTSGFRNAPEVHESRPPRKRRPKERAFSDSTSRRDAEKPTGLTNGGSNGKYPPPQNGMPSEPEVERCPSDLSTAPPDIAAERSPSVEITQRSEDVAVDRRTVDCFAHAPRKRFRYEYMSYVDSGTITNGHDTAAAASVDIGQTGSGNDVINLTTSTRAGSYREKTRDVAVQCVLAAEDDESSEELTALGFSDPRRAIYRQQLPTCGCSTSAGNLASFYCWYCGIVFDDDVLHAIHMGCHSVADKFVCNVCGLACGDRYGFNSHLVRGHVQATAVSEQPGPGSVLSLQLPGTARLVPQTVSLPFSSRPTSSAADSRCCTAYDRC